jgi:hypothetical protein
MLSSDDESNDDANKKSNKKKQISKLNFILPLLFLKVLIRNVRSYVGKDEIEKVFSDPGKYGRRNKIKNIVIKSENDPKYNYVIIEFEEKGSNNWICI